MNHWILDENKKPKQVDLTTWATWFEKGDHRIVKQETVGDAKVSTVFLGLDHNFGGGGPPILWETMVFGGKHDQWQERCAGNWEQAESMHHQVVEMVKQTEEQNNLGDESP